MKTDVQYSFYSDLNPHKQEGLTNAMVILYGDHELRSITYNCNGQYFRERSTFTPNGQLFVLNITGAPGGPGRSARHPRQPSANAARGSALAVDKIARPEPGGAPRPSLRTGRLFAE